MSLKNKISDAIYYDLIENVRMQSRADNSELKLFMSWSPNINTLIEQMIEDKDLSSLAKIYEIIGVFDLNLNKDNQTEEVYYMVTYLCSCYYNYALGQGYISKNIAQRIYGELTTKYVDKYQFDIVERYTLKELEEDGIDHKISDYTDCVLYVELLADICLFFNHPEAIRLFNKAKEMYTIINQVDKSYLSYKFMHYSWDEPMRHSIPALKLCFDLDLSTLDDMECIERINKKESLLDRIQL